MALDRQRILNELGSVMNQLKSADCGCMGKLFGSAGQSTASPSPLPTCGGCRRNCCHGHGYNSNESRGEPYPGNAQNFYTPCMGRCNPRKLYTETYNYLTDNLMQPTVKEVYDDLKSLTPENSIANNPLANKMGLYNGLAAQGNMGEMTNMGNTNNMGNMGNKGNIMSNTYACNSSNISNMHNDYNPYSNFTGKQANTGLKPTNDVNLNQIGQIGGMGPQIMNMVESNNMLNQNKINSNMGQNDQLTRPMPVDAPHSPYEEIGVTPLYSPTRTDHIYNGNAQAYPSSYNANQPTMQTNMPPTTQQMAAGHLHGHHSQGVSKFNEMFPGVMNNIDGNLGFDPMTIAIQMNPANQQRTAINTISKLMQNNNLNQVYDHSANALIAGKGTLQNKIQNNGPPNQVPQSSNPLQKEGNEIIQPCKDLNDQMSSQNAANVYRNPNEQLNNHQVYTAGLGEPIPNKETNQPDQHQYNQTIMNPSSAMEPLNLSSVQPTPGQQSVNPDSPKIQGMVKEPIFPADTSRYIVPRQPKYFEYNTLGQPVQKVSAEIFRTPVPNLPQTLSPQTPSKPLNGIAKYKIKSTVSRTSLMGTKLGRTPSQLQQIYNQYKGSQSYTQQNIAAPGVNAVSHSEGKLDSHLISQPQRQIPVEKVGGDTVMHNQMRDERITKVQPVMGQVGDVPAAVKPTGEGKLNEMVPVINRKTRNGLQDMVYTSYPSSAAWTFHGVSTCSPIRNRYYAR